MNCNQLATPDNNPQATLQDIVRKTLEDPAISKVIRREVAAVIKKVPRKLKPTLLDGVQHFENELLLGKNAEALSAMGAFQNLTNKKFGRVVADETGKT